MSFSPFGVQHALVVLVAALGWWAVVLVGRRAVDLPRHRRRAAIAVLSVNVVWTLYKCTPEHWNVDTSLPLHLCDFAWMAATLSLWFGPPRERLVHQVLYYWGFGLSPLAFLTPTLTDGPDDPYYWIFWLSHWQIVAAAFHNLFVEGVRPSWSGCGRSIGVSLLVVGAVALFNHLSGTPYCFMADHDTENPTPLDLLGPWPLRALWMVVGVSALFALMTLPGRRKRNMIPGPELESERAPTATEGL